VSVHARAFVGGGFGPEVEISQREFGAVDASAGLSASADHHGNTLVAFVEQGPDGRRLVVGGAIEPPADFTLLTHSAFTRFSRPVIAWKPSSSPFGLARYDVHVDGAVVASTAGTRVTPAIPIADGTHRLTVVAVDPFGQSTTSNTIPLRIDGTPPRVRLVTHGTTLRVVVNDGPRSKSSGIARVTVSFGDGSSTTARGSVSHQYGAAGSFTVTVTARDRAGNSVRVRRRVHV
jgi:PKD domain